MLKGRVIIDVSGDLHLNLAKEHLLLENQSKSDYVLTLRFWQNPKSVVLGRGQFINREVNLDYCKNNGITIGRRLSGGGTVYQDKGNLNISFFTDKRLFPNINQLKHIRKIFTQIIQSVLKKLNIESSEKDFNLYFNDKKFAGSAGHLTSKSFLHHTTLLINANLNHLENSLLARFSDNHKRSSKYDLTTNLAGLRKEHLQELLIQELSNTFNVSFTEYFLTFSEKQKVKGLMNTIYSTEKWIYTGKR